DRRSPPVHVRSDEECAGPHRDDTERAGLVVVDGFVREAVAAKERRHEAPQGIDALSRGLLHIAGHLEQSRERLAGLNPRRTALWSVEATVGDVEPRIR